MLGWCLRAVAQSLQRVLRLHESCLASLCLRCVLLVFETDSAVNRHVEIPFSCSMLRCPSMHKTTVTSKEVAVGFGKLIGFSTSRGAPHLTARLPAEACFSTRGWCSAPPKRAGRENPRKVVARNHFRTHSSPSARVRFQFSFVFVSSGIAKF